MEILQVLEQKIAALVTLVSEFKAENASLLQTNESLLHEKKQLLDKIEQLEVATLAEVKRFEDLDREKELTKLAVDDLIKNIDLLVKEDQQ
jgi:hypothetical protein